MYNRRAFTELSGVRTFLSLGRIWLKIALKTLLVFPGMLFRALGLSRRGLRVLYYHRVNPYPFSKLGSVSREITVAPDVFSKQLAYLRKKGYRSLSPSDLILVLEGRKAVDEKEVLITFDDGFEDNLLWAAGLLRSHSFQAIFFISTDLVGKETGRIWKEGDPVGFGCFLTWEQIRQLREAGALFGSHACSHRLLTTLEYTEIKRELADSRQILEEQLGDSIQLLAYPGGDYNSLVSSAAHAAGYRIAFTTIPGTNHAGTHAAEFRRTEVSASDTFFLFKMKMAGALDWLSFKEIAILRRFVGWSSKFLFRVSVESVGAGATPDPECRVGHPQNPKRLHENNEVTRTGPQRTGGDANKQEKYSSQAESRGEPMPEDTSTEPVRGRVCVLQVVTTMGIGGVPQHLMTLVEGLSGRGYDITIACRELSEDQRIRLSRLGVQVIIVDLKRLPHPVADIKTMWHLYKLMRGANYAIVHTHMSKAALLGNVVGRMARIPVIVNTAHNLGCVAMPHPVLKLIFWAYDKLLFRLTVDAVITVSERIRTSIVRNHLIEPEKVTAIANGLSATRFEGRHMETAVLRHDLALDDRHLIIGTIARLVWFKGLETLIDAAPRVLDDFPHARFIMIGDGPLRGRLQQQVRELGIDEHVLFLGERNDIEIFLAIFDVFVLPSVSEGMPITILEAMAASKPVVATDVGGIPEIVKDEETGLLVPPKDSPRLSAALARLLANPSLRQRLGARGRERFVQYFDADRMVSATDSLYRRLLEKKAQWRGNTSRGRGGI